MNATLLKGIKELKHIHKQLLDSVYKDIDQYINHLEDQDFVKRIIRKQYHTRLYMNIFSVLIHDGKHAMNIAKMQHLLTGVCMEITTKIKTIEPTTYKELFIALEDINGDNIITTYD